MPATYTATQPSFFDSVLTAPTGSSLLKTVTQNCHVPWIESGCSIPHKLHCPRFLLWALPLRAVYTQVCLCRSVTSRKLCHSSSMLPLGRIPPGQPFDYKDHTAPSVEWLTFWILFLQGQYSHPFISDALEEELLISRAHWKFEGKSLWIRNPILHLFLYFSVAGEMVGENVQHSPQTNLWLLSCWLCSSQLRNAHFIPVVLCVHSVSLGIPLLVAHIHADKHAKEEQAYIL